MNTALNTSAPSANLTAPKATKVAEYKIRRDVFARMIQAGGIEHRQDSRYTDDYAWDAADNYGKMDHFLPTTCHARPKWERGENGEPIRVGESATFDLEELTGKGGDGIRVYIEVWSDGTIRGWFHNYHFLTVEFRGAALAAYVAKKAKKSA